MGRRVKPAKVKVEMELAAARRELTEALEQQAAAGEILRVISSSPTDVQPVFDMIAARAMTLCDAEISLVQRSDGEQLHLAAIHGADPVGVEVARNSFPMPLSTESCAGRAVRTRGVVHLADVLDDPTYALKEQARAMRFRSGLAVPMLRDEQVIGAVYVGRSKRGLFSDTQVELLKTFADQAVIAIENVRLFTELEARNRDLSEALEQQTATSEILRVISRSPTDVQQVFATLAERAVKLCSAELGVVSTIDGEHLHMAAMFGLTDERAEATRRAFPMPLDAESTSARAVRSRAVAHFVDTIADPHYEYKDTARAGQWRGTLAAPMFRRDQVIGAIFVARANPGPFSDTQVELLKTFADQAVIAIENVRLFTELEEKNTALTTAHAQVTESLEQQTATSEILRAISQAQTDAQPVFQIIAVSARRLCGAAYAQVQLYDGERIHLAALDSVNPEGDAAIWAVYPLRVGDGSAGGRAIATRAVVQIPDLLDDRAYRFASVWEASGLRSLLAVPMMREGEPIGTIGIGRVEPDTFLQTQIDLLRTFADQAVIAIENVRLFKELEARTQDLTRSVGELRALGEVGQAISSTLDLQTVLSTVVARATQLSGTDAGVIYEYDELREVFVPRATEHLEAEIVETMLSAPVRKGEGATGRLAEAQEPIQVPDILAAPAESRVRGALVRAGYRALLAIPLVREDHLLGGLTVIRKAIGEFAPEVIELLQTFATQSSLAIQNARLFLEIEDKSRQLQAASQHKSEFLANMSHELRTPLNAIIGFSEALTERMFGELNEKQDEYLKDIYASGQHLLSLINDILDLSKIEAGRMELELTDFDLPSAIDNALTLVRERAGRRGIMLGRAIDERVGTVQADERKVKQVVLNLLSNAIKFTPEGGRIDIRAAMNEGLVEVSVTDTGVGIAPEDQETVFEEFRQVGTADKKVEGTGLGLALSRKFIALHGGRIWVRSQVGQGSTFTFTLPVRRQPSD